MGSARVSSGCKKSKKYVQSRLQIGKKRNEVIKCSKCEMTYSPSVINDINAHKVYHDMHLKGRKWSNSWGLEVNSFANDNCYVLTPPSSSSSKGVDGGFFDDRIVMIRPDFAGEVKAAMELLDIVNDELNAPHDENDFWSQNRGQGKAFVYIKNKRAVGVITMEVLDSDRGRWMVYNTKSIIEHVRPNFLVGISRIWVCRTERCAGVATRLLEVARDNTIYGKTIEKWEVAWSQPTESGGKLASKYNGRKHKSGKLLLPCYI